MRFSLFNIFSRIFRKKKGHRLSSYDFPPEIQEMFDALCECHLGDHSKYFEKLKKLSGTYPDEPLFFLFAGDVVRNSNHEKALEIHREVLFRPSTSGVLRSVVLEHIAQDYIVMSQPKKALSVLRDAVKCSEYPSASRFLSEVYESEGDFDNAFSEMKRYVTLTAPQNEYLLQRLCLKIAAFYLKQGTDKNLSLKWLEAFSKRCGDDFQSDAADLADAVVRGQNTKAAEALKRLIGAGESGEILGRSFLLNYQNGAEINYAVEGAFKEVFHLLFNKNLKAGQLGNLSESTLVFRKLMIRNNLPDASFKSLDAIVPDHSLFVCQECGQKLEDFSLVCPCCQKVTGRKFAIIPEG